MAKKRLKSLESKLAKDPDLRSNVHQQINDYVENNYAHIATEAELKLADPRRVWYLPMSVVTHPRKPNKTRLVWDAAAQISGVSLNSQLLKGPDLLNSLPGVIKDKQAQRFLFRFDEKLQPDVYVMDVATFGATCSPCSAQYILNKNANENAAEFPEAAAAIKGKTYMDDYFDSADTTEQALHVFTDASELCYGCAAYFRIVMNGEVQCALVMAKSKVAPLKYQSIPWMELQAAMLGARIMRTVCEIHTLSIAEKFIHTDAEVVLSWIRSQHRNYKQFVAFRVGEILSLPEPDDWRYVPSKDNNAGPPIETIKATKAQRKLILRSLPARTVPLRQQEYQQAERYLFRVAQTESYPDETKTLLSNQNVSQSNKWISIEKSSPLYRMSPFADEFGVIRVEGRTANASFATFDARFPIILPKDHLITKLLLNAYHCRYGHANRETVVNEVRQRFHIFNLRLSIDKVMRNCQRCKVTKCQPVNPRIGPLPEVRLMPFVKPFSYVGIDYLGPVEVTVGRRKEKRYVAVFTCLVVRAVHLEVTHNLSSDSCIMAISRFVRRRGSPVEIFSDNGTNFVGASNELAEQILNIHNDCAETFTDARTKWSFNPPSAPHMGGIWERMVRSVK
ncbi:uncharacterized protein LOC129717142 [Wyeomyia smithii]|uniref:uncharacterized protein LOC129717142 n=1 Tax=Wyeomyia smithii TaxID=174621 RepID=UPI002467E8F6|nr:uncharacterized protein LOC129717142 [Wyeomyia smithii]